MPTIDICGATKDSSVFAPTVCLLSVNGLRFVSVQPFTAKMSIPMEIFEDILSRLPVKPLLRFRCISPPFRNLIDSPNFVKLHLARSIDSQNHLNAIFSSSNQRPHAAKLEPSVLSLEATELHHHPLRDEIESQIQVWGSCNGLILLSNESNTLAIWNPSTREFMKLPSFGFEFKAPQVIDHYLCRNKFGFGYDAASHDYKVLNIMTLEEKMRDPVDEYQVKVYSVKSNSWHNVEMRFHHLPYICRETGVLASGALHWVMGLLRDMVGIIVAFDLGKEEWRSVPVPYLGDVALHMKLESYQDSLCLVADFLLGFIEIWVMKEYGVEESWTRMFSLRNDLTRPVYFPKKSDEVLMQHAGGIIWFDTVNSKPWYETVNDTVHEHRKNIVVRGLDKLMRVDVYNESLVRLDGFSKMKYKKRKKNEMAGFLSKGFKLKL